MKKYRIRQNLDYMNNMNVLPIILKVVTETEINNIIKKMNTSKACGPTSIPSHLLKLFSSQLAIPLTLIINKCFLTGEFPNLLKLANAIPIYKKNEKNLCCNYRPISLLSNISKIFEKTMHSRVYEHLEQNDLIYKHQYGFRKQHSTNHAITCMIEKIKQKLDKKIWVAGVFIDLEKAFDTVNHNILLQKLSHYGIAGTALSWFTSYLTNRHQRVSLDGNVSDYKKIVCGVPQGSILGPLLFLVYLNDLHNAIKNCTTFHFADDTELTCWDKNSKT